MPQVGGAKRQLKPKARIPFAGLSVLSVQRVHLNYCAVQRLSHRSTMPDGFYRNMQPCRVPLPAVLAWSDRLAVLELSKRQDLVAVSVTHQRRVIEPHHGLLQLAQVLVRADGCQQARLACRD